MWLLRFGKSEYGEKVQYLRGRSFDTGETAGNRRGRCRNEDRRRI